MLKEEYNTKNMLNFLCCIHRQLQENEQYAHEHIELEKVCDTISKQVQRTCPQLILPLAGSPEHQTQRSFPGYWMIMMRGNMMR